MRVELLDSRPNAFMVSHAIGSDDGEVTHIQGWVDARFVIESSAIYVAMHPTAIYVAPNTDAKIIMMIDTYDSFCLAEYSYEQVEQYEQTKDICIGGVFVGR